MDRSIVQATNHNLPILAIRQIGTDARMLTAKVWVRILRGKLDTPIGSLPSSVPELLGICSHGVVCHGHGWQRKEDSNDR